MTAYCPHCRTPREVKAFEHGNACVWCGYLFNDKPDTSPPDPQERKAKQRQEQAQYEFACENEERE